METLGLNRLNRIVIDEKNRTCICIFIPGREPNSPGKVNNSWYEGKVHILEAFPIQYFSIEFWFQCVGFTLRLIYDFQTLRILIYCL